MTRKSSAMTSEIVEMAWCDKTSFDDIYAITGLSEPETILVMRRTLKASSFRLWRQRVSGRSTKHKKLARRTHKKICML